MSGAGPPLLVAALGAALLFPLQARIDAARESTPPPDVLQTLPPRAILPVLALGHRETAADLLEVRATNFLMRWLGRMNRMRHDHVMSLYDALLTLDPRDPGAYWRAAVYLFSVADRPDLAAEVVERGMASVPVEHPARWRLFLERASMHLLTSRGLPEAQRLAAVRSAGQLLIETAELPGAPGALRQIGERFATRGQTRLEGLGYEERLWLQRSQEGEAEMRARARARLLETSSAIVLEALREVAKEYAAELGQPPQSLIDLNGFARERLRRAHEARQPPGEALEALAVRGMKDPLGYGYVVLPDGWVLAPALEARQLERALNERFLVSKQRLGRTPTAAELGVERPPPYLELTIDDEGVRVTPR